MPRSNVLQYEITSGNPLCPPKPPAIVSLANWHFPAIKTPCKFAGQQLSAPPCTGNDQAMNIQAPLRLEQSSTWKAAYFLLRHPQRNG